MRRGERHVPDTTGTVLVIGLGEVGRPLLDVLQQTYRCAARDVAPVDVAGPIAVLHVCYPYGAGDFVRITADYIAQYRPDLTIVHSTVVPGTTRAVAAQSGGLVAYSPVRGKHAQMRDELRRYTKYVAGAGARATEAAAAHLSRAGMRTEPFGAPDALEVAKLLETTYLGVLVAWAQEMERFCRACGADYDEVMQFMREIDYLPPVVFRPGFIGGHCVIPNTALLDRVRPSVMVDAVRASNDQTRQEWTAAGRSLEERLAPRRQAG